jgi:hypothetical protein
VTGVLNVMRQVENWVEPALPLDDAARNLAFMLEHNIFEISPMRGELPPGASCRLSITYKHISPGLHDLPLLLTVAQGKSVRLHLQGATVSPSVQALLKTNEHHTLLPMPIGDPDPPTQVNFPCCADFEPPQWTHTHTHTHTPASTRPFHSAYDPTLSLARSNYHEGIRARQRIHPLEMWFLKSNSLC